MTIEQSEAELIRLLDAKVAAGFRLKTGGGWDGCGCALSAISGANEMALSDTAKRVFGWTRDQSYGFMFGFDGKSDHLSYKDEPLFGALGDRIARRYGVR